MKKIFLSTLSVLMMTNASFAGNDKGNAGDGLIVNNEVVMRDFVKGATLTTIENNAEFLAGIPDFKELIAEIAQANGNIALHILSDLANKVYYVSQDPLPKESDIEPLLYFFDGSYILVSPNFFKVRSQSHILVTEALRPYVSPNVLYRGSNYERRSAEANSAFLRAATYVNTNRGSYKSKTLTDSFEDLIGDSSYKSLAPIFFNSKLSHDVRCAALREQQDQSILFLEEYLNLPCDLLNKPYGYYQERVLAAAIPMPGWKFSETPDQLNDHENYPSAMVVNYSSEVSRGSNERKRSCEGNVATIKFIPEALKKTQLKLDMLTAIIRLIESKSSTAEGQIIAHYVHDVKRLKEMADFALTSKNATLRSKQFIAKELAYCATWGIK